MQARQSTQLDRDFVSLSPNDISGFLYGIGIVNTMAAAPCRKAMGHGSSANPTVGSCDWSDSSALGAVAFPHHSTASLAQLELESCAELCSCGPKVSHWLVVARQKWRAVKQTNLTSFTPCCVLSLLSSLSFLKVAVFWSTCPALSVTPSQSSGFQPVCVSYADSEIACH